MWEAIQGFSPLRKLTVSIRYLFRFPKRGGVIRRA